MPKVTTNTLLSKRNFVVILAGPLNNMESNPRMLAMSIVDELRAFMPKVSVTGAAMDQKDGFPEDRSFGLMSSRLDVLHRMSLVTNPTVIVTDDIFAQEEGDAEGVNTYIKLLLMSRGGIIVQTGPHDGEPIFEGNRALPMFKYDLLKDSFEDLRLKLRPVLRKVCDPKVVDYYRMLNSLTTQQMDQLSNGSVLLGDTSSVYVDAPTERNTVRTIINLDGQMDVPISLEEFMSKVWSSSSLNRDMLDPETTLVFRNPCATVRIVLGKLLDRPGVKTSGIRSITI